MRNYQIDEASERQPQVQVVNSEKVRLYFGHEEVEREGMDGKEMTVHIAKFVELPASLGTDPLELAKAAVTAEITEYDSSDAVNDFIFGGKHHWIPREDRVIYEARLEEDKERGRETIRFELPDADPSDEPLTLPIAQAEAMLKQLKYYATDSFDVTQDHIRAVAVLSSVNEVLAYDYTTGYPEKINFDTMFAK